MTRTLLPLVLALPLLSACSDEPEDFRSRAAIHCTEIVNDHLDAPRDDSGVEVLQALFGGDGEEPSPEQLSSWSDSVTADLERREAVREALGEISSDDASEQEQWQQMVDAGDERLELVRERAELLQTQDWEQIRAGFTPGGSTAPGPEEALSALGLEFTDCAWVHGAAGDVSGADAGSADFIRAATTTCTEIGNRRHLADYQDDVDLSTELLGQIIQDGAPEEVPEDAVDALDRVREEWVQTVEDLESVDTEGAGDPGAWDEIIAAAQERVDVYGQRAEAAASGDATALAEAYDLSWEHPWGDFEPLGLNYRSCDGVHF